MCTSKSSIVNMASVIATSSASNSSCTQTNGVQSTDIQSVATPVSLSTYMPSSSSSSTSYPSYSCAVTPLTAQNMSLICTRVEHCTSSVNSMTATLTTTATPTTTTNVKTFDKSCNVNVNNVSIHDRSLTSKKNINSILSPEAFSLGITESINYSSVPSTLYTNTTTTATTSTNSSNYNCVNNIGPVSPAIALSPSVSVNSPSGCTKIPSAEERQRLRSYRIPHLRDGKNIEQGNSPSVNSTATSAGNSCGKNVQQQQQQQSISSCSISPNVSKDTLNVPQPLNVDVSTRGQVDCSRNISSRCISDNNTINNRVKVPVERKSAIYSNSPCSSSFSSSSCSPSSSIISSPLTSNCLSSISPCSSSAAFSAMNVQVNPKTSCIPSSFTPAAPASSALGGCMNGVTSSTRVIINDTCNSNSNTPNARRDTVDIKHDASRAINSSRDSFSTVQVKPCTISSDIISHQIVTAPDVTSKSLSSKCINKHSLDNTLKCNNGQVNNVKNVTLTATTSVSTASSNLSKELREIRFNLDKKKKPASTVSSQVASTSVASSSPSSNSNVTSIPLTPVNTCSQIKSHSKQKSIKSPFIQCSTDAINNHSLSTSTVSSCKSNLTDTNKTSSKMTMASPGALNKSLQVHPQPQHAQAHQQQQLDSSSVNRVNISTCKQSKSKSKASNKLVHTANPLLPPPSTSVTCSTSIVSTFSPASASCSSNLSGITLPVSSCSPSTASIIPTATSVTYPSAYSVFLPTVDISSAPLTSSVHSHQISSDSHSSHSMSHFCAQSTHTTAQQRQQQPQHHQHHHQQQQQQQAASSSQHVSTRPNAQLVQLTELILNMPQTHSMNKKQSHTNITPSNVNTTAVVTPTTSTTVATNSTVATFTVNCSSYNSFNAAAATSSLSTSSSSVIPSFSNTLSVSVSSSTTGSSVFPRMQQPSPASSTCSSSLLSPRPISKMLMSPAFRCLKYSPSGSIRSPSSHERPSSSSPCISKSLYKEPYNKQNIMLLVTSLKKLSLPTDKSNKKKCKESTQNNNNLLPEIFRSIDFLSNLKKKSDHRSRSRSSSKPSKHRHKHHKSKKGKKKHKKDKKDKSSHINEKDKSIKKKSTSKKRSSKNCQLSSGSIGSIESSNLGQLSSGVTCGVNDVLVSPNESNKNIPSSGQPTPDLLDTRDHLRRSRRSNRHNLSNSCPASPAVNTGMSDVSSVPTVPTSKTRNKDKNASLSGHLNCSNESTAPVNSKSDTRNSSNVWHSSFTKSSTSTSNGNEQSLPLKKRTHRHIESKSQSNHHNHNTGGGDAVKIPPLILKIQLSNITDGNNDVTCYNSDFSSSSASTCQVIESKSNNFTPLSHEVSGKSSKKKNRTPRYEAANDASVNNKSSKSRSSTESSSVNKNSSKSKTSNHHLSDLNSPAFPGDHDKALDTKSSPEAVASPSPDDSCHLIASSTNSISRARVASTATSSSSSLTVHESTGIDKPSEVFVTEETSDFCNILENPASIGSSTGSTIGSKSNGNRKRRINRTGWERKKKKKVKTVTSRLDDDEMPGNSDVTHRNGDCVDVSIEQGVATPSRGKKQRKPSNQIEESIVNRKSRGVESCTSTDVLHAAGHSVALVDKETEQATTPANTADPVATATRGENASFTSCTFESCTSMTSPPDSTGPSSSTLQNSRLKPCASSKSKCASKSNKSNTNGCKKNTKISNNSVKLNGKKNNRNSNRNTSSSRRKSKTSDVAPTALCQVTPNDEPSKVNNSKNNKISKSNDNNTESIGTHEPLVATDADAGISDTQVSNAESKKTKKTSSKQVKTKVKGKLVKRVNNNTIKSASSSVDVGQSKSAKKELTNKSSNGKKKTKSKKNSCISNGVDSVRLDDAKVIDDNEIKSTDSSNTSRRTSETYSEAELAKLVVPITGPTGIRLSKNYICTKFNKPKKSLYKLPAKKYLKAGLFSDEFKKNSPVAPSAEETAALAIVTETNQDTDQDKNCISEKCTDNSSISKENESTTIETTDSRVESASIALDNDQVDEIDEREKQLLPLPVYAEKEVLFSFRDFNLPYDLYLHHLDRQADGKVNDFSNYHKIKTNTLVDRPISRDCQQICDCKPPRENDTEGCGSECINRMILMECPRNCPCQPNCSNQRMFKHQWAPALTRFMTNDKGWGVRAEQIIKKGDFIMEYIGEVVTHTVFRQRMANDYKDSPNHYCLYIDGNYVIDGYKNSNECRFVNHSCEPNCEMQKWTVNGLYRVGLFALRDIQPGEELSYDYNFQSYDTSNQQPCMCASVNCRGFIGGRKKLERRSSVDTTASTSNISNDKQTNNNKKRKNSSTNSSGNKSKKIKRNNTTSESKSKTISQNVECEMSVENIKCENIINDDKIHDNMQVDKVDDSVENDDKNTATRTVDAASASSTTTTDDVEMKYDDTDDKKTIASSIVVKHGSEDDSHKLQTSSSIDQTQVNGDHCVTDRVDPSDAILLASVALQVNDVSNGTSDKCREIFAQQTDTHVSSASSSSADVVFSSVDIKSESIKDENIITKKEVQDEPETSSQTTQDQVASEKDDKERIKLHLNDTNDQVDDKTPLEGINSTEKN